MAVYEFHHKHVIVLSPPEWIAGFTQKTYLNTKETKIPRHGKPEGSVSDVCALSQDIGQPYDKKKTQ